MKKILNQKFKISLVVISLLLILSIIIGTSYAYFMFNTTQDNNSIASSDCFKLTYADRNDINLESAIPLSEEEAENLTPYEFTIRNVCKHAASYSVNIEKLNDSTLDEQYLRYSLDDEESKILGSNLTNATLINVNAISSRTIKKAILLPDEEITYNLRLWIDEDASIEAAGKTYESKVVIVANLNKNPYYIVTLDANGGEVDYSALEIVNDRVVGNLPTPKRSGYIFNGWFDENDNQITEMTVIKANKTIHAAWLKGNYSLSVDPNGGVWERSSAIQTFDLDYEDEKEISNPVKVGHTFTNWTLEGNGSTLENNIFKMGIENATLTANYDIDSYKLTIENSYTCDGEYTLEYNEDKSICTPTREGYTFDGWSVSGEDSTIENNTFTMGVENATLHANWITNDYSWIVYHKKQDLDGVNYTLDYTESGTGAFGSNFVGTLRNYNGFTNPVQESKTIVADSTPLQYNKMDYNYTRNQYKLTVDPNGGSYNDLTTPTEYTMYYDENKVIANPTKACHTFRTWTIEGEGSSISGTTFNMGYHEASLTANYTLNRLTITFDANGGTVDPSSSQIDCGTTLSLPTPQRAGYFFDGWFTLASGGEEVTSQTIFTTSQTIHAHWTRITSDIVLYSNSTYTTCTTLQCALDELSNVN